MLALFTVFFVAYCLTEAFEKDGEIAGLLSLVSFMVVTPLGQMKVGANLAGVIPFDWLGSKGLFVALIVGLLVGRIYVWILDRNLVIKLPDGVPPTISKSFIGLVPGFANILKFVYLARCQLYYYKKPLKTQHCSCDKIETLLKA